MQIIGIIIRKKVREFFTIFSASKTEICKFSSPFHLIHPFMIILHLLLVVCKKTLNMDKKWKHKKKCYIHISYIFSFFINKYSSSMQQLRQLGVKIVLDPLFFLLYFWSLSLSLSLSLYLLFIVWNLIMYITLWFSFQMESVFLQ